jgi:WD40 repeat protein
VKALHPVIFLCLAAILAAACNQATPLPEGTRLPMPTANVPSLTTIDAAIKKWQNSKDQNYFIEVDERTQDGSRKVRVVVADGQVRAAQTLDKDASGNWGDPVSLPGDQAQAYTVDGLLERVRREATGQGPVPLNMRVAFDPSLGFPAIVYAEALPTYDANGDVLLNRQYNYELGVTVKALLEDTFGVGRDPVFTYLRSDGSQAWCDALRIFSDGSSVYGDDCRNQVLQLTLPADDLQALQQLRSGFNGLDLLREQDGGSERLIITGTGDGSPDAAAQDNAWQLAVRAYDLLSRPIGLGLTMTYIQGGKLYGYDVYNNNTSPSQLVTSGDIHGVAFGPDQKRLAFSDDTGLNLLEIDSGKITRLLASPEAGYYLPRAWSSNDNLLVGLIGSSGGEAIQLGWVPIAQPSFYPLPLPADSPGYGCDTGAAWSPDGTQLAIAGLGYGSGCNLNPGLTIVNLAKGESQRIVGPLIASGEDSGSTLVAGARTPAWSPDGSWITFGLDQDASTSTGALNFPTRLYRVHPDGSNLTPLTNNAQGVASDPAWSPDGTLYYSLSGVSAEADGIYRYTTTDNFHSLLIPGTDLHALSVSPDDDYLLYEQAGALMLWGFVRGEALPAASVQDENPPVFAGWIKTN